MSSITTGWKVWRWAVLKLACVIGLSCLPFPIFVPAILAVFSEPGSPHTWLFLAVWLFYAALCMRWVMGRPVSGVLLAGGWLSLLAFCVVLVVLMDVRWYIYLSGLAVTLFFGSGPLLLALYFTLDWFLARHAGESL